MEKEKKIRTFKKKILQTESYCVREREKRTANRKSNKGERKNNNKEGI